MAKELCDAFAPARDVLDQVDDALGVKLSTLMFEGPADELTRTHNAQPALLAHSAAVWVVVRHKLATSCVAAAGHSLGEFSAYHVAGSLSLADAARIVRTRGTLMFETGQQRPGAMSAILGTMNVSIDDICATATKETAMVVPANYNSAEQVVISGEVAGVERAMQLAKEAGAKRCMPLPVSGAFHSPLMAPAENGLRAALDAVVMNDPSMPIVANVNAEPITTATQAKTLLVEQLTSPVRWIAVIERLASLFPDALFVEMGAGAVLTGLTKRIAPSVKTASCGTPAEVESLMQLVNA